MAAYQLVFFSGGYTTRTPSPFVSDSWASDMFPAEPHLLSIYLEKTLVHQGDVVTWGCDRFYPNPAK